MKARGGRLRFDAPRREEHTVTMPATPRSPLGSLDGPSKTIRVEPVETPLPVPAPRVEPEPSPRRDAPPTPAPPARSRARRAMSARSRSRRTTSG
jgi:hypothetical protein